MNVFLWILQVILALHTMMGAAWKFSHPTYETMPSFGIIPDEIWLLLAIIEILCALFLLLPLFYKKSLSQKMAPIAALVIVAEMIVFSVIQRTSLDQTTDPIIYWLIVAAISGFLAYGRFSLRPHVVK